MKVLTNVFQQNLDCQTESIEIEISEHGQFSSDSMKNEVITTMKGGFYLMMAYNKQLKNRISK